MHYFLRELNRGNRLYWAAVGFMAAWTVSIIDLFSNFCKGVWFGTTLAATVITAVGYFVYEFAKERVIKKKQKDVEEFAAIYEPKREEEIREILKKNPDFVTHCYECIHFDSKLLHCSKTLSKNISHSHVQEIRINGKKYCLYWVRIRK
jgi:hypothetical protein